MMFQQHAIHDRHTEKDRRVIFTEDATNYFGRRFLATKNRRKAVQQRKRKAVAEPVGKRQTRRRKQTIAFAQAQHFTTESFVCIEDVRLAVHSALRFAGAAGGVENEGVGAFISLWKV